MFMFIFFREAAARGLRSTDPVGAAPQGLSASLAGGRKA